MSPMTQLRDIRDWTILHQWSICHWQQLEWRTNTSTILISKHPRPYFCQWNATLQPSTYCGWWGSLFVKWLSPWTVTATGRPPKCPWPIDFDRFSWKLRRERDSEVTYLLYTMMYVRRTPKRGSKYFINLERTLIDDHKGPFGKFPNHFEIAGL